MSYRIWKAIFALLILMPIVFWALIQKESKLVSTSRETAILNTVKEVSAEMEGRFGGSTTITFYRGCLELPDGTEIEISLRPPIPTTGKVPIIVDHFDNGKKFYSIDREKIYSGDY